jgi:hypothetical protein
MSESGCCRFADHSEIVRSQLTAIPNRRLARRGIVRDPPVAGDCAQTGGPGVGRRISPKPRTRPASGVIRNQSVRDIYFVSNIHSKAFELKSVVAGGQTGSPASMRVEKVIYSG